MANAAKSVAMQQEEIRLIKARQQAAMNALPKEELQEYREIFDLVDLDRGGSIEKEELSELMDMLSMDFGDDEIELMMTEIDEDGDGEIDFAEFVAVMSKKVRTHFETDRVLDAFKMLHRDGDDVGMVRATTLMNALMNDSSKRMSSEQAHELVNQMMPSSNGMIHYADFVKIMME